MLMFRTLALALFVAGAAHAQNLPIADAGPDQTFDCTLPAGLEVTLDGSASSDGDTGAQPLTYSWTDAGGVELSTAAMPALLFAPGTHVLALTVNDGVDGDSGATDDGTEDDSTVTIVVNADVTPPELVMAYDSDVLFPPNHKTHPYAIADLVESVTDDCSELTIDDVVFSGGSSDELDNGTGDGNTKGDLDFCDVCSEVRVRAERAGHEDGRVYTLNLYVDDEAGNRTTESFEIGVPHDRGRGHKAVDSGVAAEYFSACYDGAGPARCPLVEDLTCSEATGGSLSLKDGRKPRLRLRTYGAAPAAGAPLVCLYEGGALVGGTDSLRKLKVRGDAISASAKGDSVMVPNLPAAGALRAEYHSGGSCVAESFANPKLNAAGKYRAKNK